MKNVFLEISQMIDRHPIMREKEAYKVKYINVLEYFVRMYSHEDVWANEVLCLYINKLLSDGQNYRHNGSEFQKQSQDVLATKFRPFKFFSYRYCLLMDCIFMNAYGDWSKGQKIFEDISAIYHQRYQEKIRRLFQFLYFAEEPIDDIGQITYLKECWNRNRNFIASEPIKIIVTANMSAGKSTLLNALVGKKVNKTQNDACTAKIHYIKNKPFEDNLCYEQDGVLVLDADHQTLMEDNPINDSNSVTVATCFRTAGNVTKRIWFIDTPGVNSSQNIQHKQMTEDTIRSAEADLMLYVLNGENIGTDDDRRHLIFVSENFHGDVIFIVNKVDRFRKKEDSVYETINTVKVELSELGFNDPVVVPISSYAAYLAKMKMFGEELDEDELDEFERMARKLKKEEYQFNTYYPADIQMSVGKTYDSDAAQLLMHSGILQLEQMIYNMR